MNPDLEGGGLGTEGIFSKRLCLTPISQDWRSTGAGRRGGTCRPWSAVVRGKSPAGSNVVVRQCQ